MRNRFLLVAATMALVSGCGDGGAGSTAGSSGSSSSSSSSGDVTKTPEASQDWARDILSTGLDLDLASKKGTATIRLASSESTGASFEIAGLTIEGVRAAEGDLKFAVTGGQLDVGVPSAAGDAELTIDYTFAAKTNFDGYIEGMDTGLTFLWPTFCGNLFPCKSDPNDGLTFTMKVSGEPAGTTLVFPSAIASDAPSYMPALAFGEYTYKSLGTTKAGTKVGVWYLPNGEADADMGTKDLAAVFDFLETTYGPYSFGGEVASVAADWGPGDFGGMEHHPFWHVHTGSMNDPVTHAHEAAHGWFGDGVRIRCWEDFVLSEGTVSYLAARSLEVVGGAAVGQAIWDDYQVELDAVVMDGDTIALPDTCNVIELISDPLWSSVPYMKGAFFYKAVADQVGAAALDGVIASFYKANVGKAAGMQDMVDAIKAGTGFDATALAQGWLRSLGVPKP